MSRMMILGVLAVLAVLLGVLTHMVNPVTTTPEAPATPPKTAADMAGNEKLKIDALAKKDQDNIRAGMKPRPQAVAVKAVPKGAADLPGPKPKAPPKPSTMQISGDWWRKGKDGAEGIPATPNPESRGKEYVTPAPPPK